MTQTHLARLPIYSLLCSLGKEDRVIVNYRPKKNGPRIELKSNGKRLAVGDDILRSHGRGVLYLGKMEDAAVGRTTDLYCRDLRLIAAVERYIRHWRFDNYNSDEETEPEVLQPFPDEKSAIAYLKEVGQWEIMNGNYSLYPLSNWQPI